MLGSYRAYNPALLRFHNSDNLSPFGKGGLNSYGYCLGDPVNHVDPTGHTALWRWSALPVRLSVATTVAAVAVGLAATVVPKGKAQDVLIKTATGLLAATAVLAALPALKSFMPKQYRYIGRLLNGGGRQGGRRASTTSGPSLEMNATTTNANTLMSRDDLPVYPEAQHPSAAPPPYHLFDPSGPPPPYSTLGIPPESPSTRGPSPKGYLIQSG